MLRNHCMAEGYAFIYRGRTSLGVLQTRRAMSVPPSAAACSIASREPAIPKSGFICSR
jgi:hypothetical protein